MNSLQEITFDDAYKMFHPKILQYCYHKTNNNMNIAEEISQEAFLALYLSWDKLYFHSKALIFSWLHKTAKNMLSKYFRQLKKLSNTISYDEYFSQYQDIGVSDDNLENLDLSYEKYIEEIKKFLSPEDFQLFTYACIEKLSIIQISLLLNINFNTAKSRIRRMKSKLKLFLSDF